MFYIFNGDVLESLCDTTKDFDIFTNGGYFTNTQMFNICALGNRCDSTQLKYKLILKTSVGLDS